MNQLVITVVGADHPGIVESLARVVADHEGNWLSSSMSNLAGQFAGIIEVAVAEERRDALANAIGALEGLQVHSVTGGAPIEVGQVPMAELEVVGVDQPGIVRRVTAALKEGGVNLLQFASWTEPAPNSGDELFRAVAEFEMPADEAVEALKVKLEALTEDLAVDIELGLDEG
ncbi:glycine cleavage system protein R [bacterium DOLZORAL124_64_63]|nr:MAG: glycine cleavage system protein R [bacterium DOLZORAL124_64_63]